MCNFRFYDQLNKSTKKHYHSILDYLRSTLPQVDGVLQIQNPIQIPPHNLVFALETNIQL